MDEQRLKLILKKYAKIIEILKNDGFIRTSNLVQGYGEYVVCKRLNLEQNRNPVTKGYDAVDSKGKKYEIKARKEVSWNKPTKISVNVDELNHADFLVYVEFRNDWELKELLKFPIKDVKRMWANKKHLHIASKELKAKYSLITKTIKQSILNSYNLPAKD